MPPDDIFAVAFATVATSIIVGLARYLAPSAKANRELRKTPRRTLAELPEGTVARVIGKTEQLEDTLEAPLSGRRCLYYTAIVFTVDGKTRRELIRDERGVPFILDDGTARAIVDPSGCRPVLGVDTGGASGTFKKPSGRELAFLVTHGEAPTESVFGFFNRDLHYRESVIEAGETITIVGEGVREPDPDATPAAAYRGDQPTRLRMTSSRKQPMIISDSPSATR
jgi:hypothetical protein